MDLRIEKTKKAIRSAFIELRAKKSLEKITVKELCALACINKSTFYSHYEDIYALSEAMEQETVASIISGIDHLKDYTFENSDVFSRELCLAFMSQISLIRILFSGKNRTTLGTAWTASSKSDLPKVSPVPTRHGEKHPVLLLYPGSVPRISEQSRSRHTDPCRDDRQDHTAPAPHGPGK